MANSQKYATVMRGVLDAAYADAKFLQAEKATLLGRLDVAFDNAAFLAERNRRLQLVSDALKVRH